MDVLESQWILCFGMILMQQTTISAANCNLFAFFCNAINFFTHLCCEECFFFLTGESDCFSFIAAAGDHGVGNTHAFFNIRICGDASEVGVRDSHSCSNLDDDCGDNRKGGWIITLVTSVMVDVVKTATSLWIFKSYCFWDLWIESNLD